MFFVLLIVYNRYDTVGRTAETTSLSGVRAAGGNAGGGWNDQRLTLADLERPEFKEQLRAKPAYFITTGYVTMTKKENAMYDSCPQCNKKCIGMEYTSHMVCGFFLFCQFNIEFF